MQMNRFILMLVTLVTLGACVAPTPKSVRALPSETVQTSKSATDIVVCMRNELGPSLEITSFPDGQRVDVALTGMQFSENRYFILASLYPEENGTRAEIKDPGTHMAYGAKDDFRECIGG